MEKRYAVAYINDGDKQTTYNGNAICLFGQTKWEVDRVSRFLIASIPVKKNADDTYKALEKAIGKKIGKEVVLEFSHRFATVWRLK